MDNNRDYIMVALNDWLEIDKTSGVGDDIITLTSPKEKYATYKRSTSLKIEGKTTNSIIIVSREKYNPIVIINPEIINANGLGGNYQVKITTTIDLELTEESDWISIDNRFPSGNITTPIENTINIRISETDKTETRQTNIIVKERGSENVLGVITVVQEAINLNDFISTIYVTSEENEVIRLTKDTYSFDLNDIGIDKVIIDGVTQTSIKDEYTIPSIGEHQIYIHFIDKIAKVVHTRGGLFINKWLKKVVIPSDYIIKLETYVGVFDNCPMLEYVDFNGCELDTYYGENVFRTCLGLKKVYNFPLLNGYSIPKNICNGCNDLEEFTLYDIAQFSYVGENAFQDCYKLSNNFCIMYLNGIDNDGQIGERAFKNCYLFRGFNDTIDLRGWYPDYGAFDGCNLLKTIHIKDFQGASYSGEPLVKVSAFNGVGEVLHLYGDTAQSLVGTTFKKVICYNLLNQYSADWFAQTLQDGQASPLLEEIEFLSEEQQDMRYTYGKFKLLPYLNKLIFHSHLPPLVDSDTLEDTAPNGVLVYPQGSDYSQLLSTDEYYLGYYGWTSETF